MHKNLTALQQEINTALESFLDQYLSYNRITKTLASAIKYVLLNPGKRLRPMMVIASAELFNVAKEQSMPTAIAIEMIHNYSLTHDDLPAFDDDDYRRGMLSCHKKFDESTAILCGESLMIGAIELLSSPKTHHDPATRCELISCITKAVGYHGMTGGQMMDMATKHTSLEPEEYRKMQMLKTGELFMASCESGAILGSAPPEHRNAMRNYAHNLGLAFQIKDDLEDEDQTKHTPNTAETKNKGSLLIKQALNNLSQYDKHKTETLTIIAEEIDKAFT